MRTVVLVVTFVVKMLVVLEEPVGSRLGVIVYVIVEKHNPLGIRVGAGQKTGSSSPLCVDVGQGNVAPFEEH